ncbi:MAG: chemotaxis protein CheC [Proteobacteria bacterium]|nr:chemotaxis protein CheC [Pseudomonadota bacterium]
MTKNILSPEQIDYIEEMMNIGAGNAATALEQLLKSRFEMCMPAIHAIAPHKAFSVIGDPAQTVTCVKMNMIGDCTGKMFFVVPLKQQKRLETLAGLSVGLTVKSGDRSGIPVFEEIGNILAGVYLTSIHDFCRLNIYHTIPVAATDMAQAVLDETIAIMSAKNELLIIIVNKFLAAEQDEAIDTYLIMIPDANSLKILTDSIREAQIIARG